VGNQVVEQFAARHLLNVANRRLAPRLLAEQLIAQLLGVFQLRGAGLFHVLLAIDPIRDVVDIAPLENRARAVMMAHETVAYQNRSKTVAVLPTPRRQQLVSY
jgi:hypothetical protein